MSQYTSRDLSFVSLSGIEGRFAGSKPCTAGHPCTNDSDNTDDKGIRRLLASDADLTLLQAQLSITA